MPKLVGSCRCSRISSSGSCPRFVAAASSSARSAEAALRHLEQHALVPVEAGQLPQAIRIHRLHRDRCRHAPRPAPRSAPGRGARCARPAAEPPGGPRRAPRPPAGARRSSRSCVGDDGHRERSDPLGAREAEAVRGGALDTDRARRRSRTARRAARPSPRVAARSRGGRRRSSGRPRSGAIPPPRGSRPPRAAGRRSRHPASAASSGG